MCKKSANLKCSNMVAFKYGRVEIWSRSNIVEFKYGCDQYGCVQIWLRSNMVALKYGRTQTLNIGHSKSGFAHTLLVSKIWF